MTNENRVWFIRYTVNGEPHSGATMSRFVAMHWAKQPNATVTQIDCAAVEELVEAVRSERKLAAMFDTGKMPTNDLARAEERTDAALAAFRSTP